jgi:hypothetical protein
MKPGDLVRIRNRWQPYGSNAENYPGPGEIVMVIGLTQRVFRGSYDVLSSKGVVTFHVSYLEVISETR